MQNVPLHAERKPMRPKNAAELLERVTLEALAVLSTPQDDELIEELLSECFACSAELTTGEEVLNGGLCVKCQQRRQWERN